MQFGYTTQTALNTLYYSLPATMRIRAQSISVIRETAAAAALLMRRQSQWWRP